jgi:AraC family transcriptional regulator
LARSASITCNRFTDRIEASPGTFAFVPPNAIARPPLNLYLVIYPTEPEPQQAIEYAAVLHSRSSLTPFDDQINFDLRTKESDQERRPVQVDPRQSNSIANRSAIARRLDGRPRATGEAVPLLAGIVEVAQHRLPAEDIASVEVERHTITLQLGPPHALAWGFDGASRRHTLIRMGNLSLVTAGTKLGWHRTEPTDVLVVTLDPRFVAALADRPARADAVAFRTLVAFEDPAIAYILRAMHAARSRRCATIRLYDEALATALVSHLLDHYAALPTQPAPPNGGLPEGRLRRVLDHIEAHLGEEMSLRQLAELVRLSPDHFATLFRQSVGLPPHRYVLEQRVERAKHLLTTGHMPLAEIGYALGYTSQAHFSTMFRKHTGFTPGTYRKLRGGGNGGPSKAANSGFHEQPSRESERRRGAAG